MEIKHFSHKHPLMFKELEQKNENNRLVFCNGCSDAEIGTCYSCNQRRLLLITCLSVAHKHPVKSKEQSLDVLAHRPY
ncbi:hypothetical protein ACFX2I_014102 [Malus domestica]